ncbi:hypothetical protein [Flavobacterium sp.]|uniref:hypothetical protein n=1 Tax=Flavobacterium sp. TaxID=239 RepID=UPI002626DF96|nr:hypothetical protein [Flavobacterium sp.]
MKKITTFTILFLAIISCTDNSTVASPTFNVTPILGKWQYSERLDYNPPGPYLIANGPIIDLKSDGTFTSNELTNYNGGTYTVSIDSILSLTYISSTSSYTWKKKIYQIDSNELFLDLDYLGTGSCTEGCAERYTKVNGN